jgi:hypothetical protein
MDRGNLLMVAERAIEVEPRAKLKALVGDMVRLDQLAEGKRGGASLGEQAHAAPSLPHGRTSRRAGRTRQ